jgi:hypothetical protein
VEVDPRTRRITWEYADEPRSRFYSHYRGANQRLPNGNTLISNSDSGHAFEVTPTGQIVWEWKNPLRNRRNRRATIYRMERLDPSYVEEILRTNR